MGQAARHIALKKADWKSNKKVLLKAWQDLLNKD
jgi:hypothetical protein